MNAVVRALRSPTDWRFSMAVHFQQMRWSFLVGLLLLLSAMGVVFMKDIHRRAYLANQDAVQQAAVLRIAHNRLLLESATHLAVARLASEAQAMGMRVPSEQQRVWLHDSGASSTR